jgi:uncharacterized membrane protein YjjP (DUF1212 family)
MPIIGTRTWWIKQFALLGVVLGVGLAAAGVVGYLGGGDLVSSAVLALLGLVGALVGTRVWKRYSNRDAVERLEQQIYGPE